MPSHFDNTYHNIFAEPEYDTPAEKKRYEAIRAADEVLELKPARLPTRAEENEYMQFLAEDFRSDPWLTFRFRKYTANPKRIPWKHSRQLKRQY